MSEPTLVGPPTETTASPTVPTTEPVTTTVDPTTTSDIPTTTPETTPPDTTTQVPPTTTADPPRTTTNGGGVTRTTTPSRRPSSVQVPVTTVISSNGRAITIISTSISYIVPTGIETQASGDTGGGSHTGAIVGGVVGGVAFVGLLGIFAFFFLKRRKKTKRHSGFNSTGGYDEQYMTSTKDAFSSRPLSSATTAPGSGSSAVARPFVAPLRPNNPEEDALYYQGRPATPSSNGYYEEQSYPSIQGGMAYAQGQYYHTDYPTQPDQPLYATQPFRQPGDGELGVPRNVPHLADEHHDIPHSR